MNGIEIIIRYIYLLHLSVHPCPVHPPHRPVHSGNVTSHHPVVIHELFSRAQQHNTTTPTFRPIAFLPTNQPRNSPLALYPCSHQNKSPDPIRPVFLTYKLSLTSSSLLQLSFFLSPFYKQQPTIPSPSLFLPSCARVVGAFCTCPSFMIPLAVVPQL
jgi:hypothetical protein